MLQETALFLKAELYQRSEYFPSSTTEVIYLQVNFVKPEPEKKDQSSRQNADGLFDRKNKKDLLLGGLEQNPGSNLQEEAGAGVVVAFRISRAGTEPAEAGCWPE